LPDIPSDPFAGGSVKGVEGGLFNYCAKAGCKGAANAARWN